MVNKSKRRKKKSNSKEETAEKEEEEFNCHDCAFQGNSMSQLIRHQQLKHGRGQVNESRIECKYCGKQFSEKHAFMIHRKSEHIRTVAQCKNNAVGRCSFVANECWWNHTEQQEFNSEKISCYICDQVFSSRFDMMMHRKNNHPNVIRTCDRFKDNNCRFREESCWFSHTNVDNKRSESKIDVEEDDDDEDIMEERQPRQSVFRKTSVNLKPPNKKSVQKEKTE